MSTEAQRPSVPPRRPAEPEVPQAAPPPPPPPAASARFPDAPPAPAFGISVDPAPSSTAPAAAPAGGAPSSRTDTGDLSVVAASAGAVPSQPAPSGPPGGSSRHNTSDGPGVPTGPGAPPRPGSAPRSAATTGRAEPPAPRIPPRGVVPPQPDAPPRWQEPPYEVPLLPADDPDADSGTFPLGRPAQGAIGTKGHIPAGGRDPGASGLSPHTGQPGASPDRRTADRAAAPDGSATSTGMPLPPAQPPGVRQTGATSAPRWAPGDAPGVAHSAATAAGRRSIGAVDLRPGPGAGRPFVFSARPESYDDSTTRLRPVRDRGRPRTLAAAACVVLGLGLIGGAATGSWLTGDSSAADPGKSFAAAADLWHNTPVDQLFPPVIHGDGAGPGGADRIWTRVAVAPDSGCDNAFDPLLYKALAPVGCLRLLRATYTDATLSQVTTVGLLFTKADPAAMGVLRSRFTRDGLDRRTDLMPRPYAAKDTDAAGFGDAQRASWTVSVLTDAPVVVYAVSGFADGRTVQDPQPAADAMETTATTAPAQAGLGFEAKGLADRVERGLRKTIGTDDADGTDGTRTEQP